MKHAFTVIEALILICIIGIVLAIIASALEVKNPKKVVVTTVIHEGHRYLHMQDRWKKHPPTVIHDPDCPHNIIEP